MAQDFIDFELLLIDDGSSDSSVDIMKAYAQRYPQKITVLTQKNKGVSSARNLGISKARGEYYAFIDSDDLWITNKLSKQWGEMVFHGWRVAQTEERWIRNGKRVNPMKKHAKHGGHIFYDCLPLCVVSPSAVMLHRSVIADVGGFDERLKVVEDYELWLRISCKYTIGLIPDPLVVKHGGHHDQLSRRFPVMDRYRVYAIRKLLKNSNKDLDPLKRNAAHWWIVQKTQIIAKGSLKRGRFFEAVRYYLLSSVHQLKWILAA
jgi:glycosyltransferase involved in cell wall biosynthesis